MKKNVNGKDVDLTAEEIAEKQQMEQKKVLEDYKEEKIAQARLNWKIYTKEKQLEDLINNIKNSTTKVEIDNINLEF